jgi:CheY-like chemotaxis protein
MSDEPGRATVDKRPRVLCVDDEPAILDGLRRQMYADFAVVGVQSGREALTLLAADPSFAVLICDMRMPGLDGAAVLSQARLVQPDTVRILLTGQADMEDAVAAVNDGNIFRFLLKPCPRSVLAKALTDALRQHRMITAEKELLERTLRGCVAALLETLSLANPLAFARAMRIQLIVQELIEAIGPEGAWCIEIAAMVSQIGTVVLAPGTLHKLNTGSLLSAEEELQVRVLPWHAERLLEQIPRLEVVRQIIHDQTTPYDQADQGLEAMATMGAQMLRLAVDLEAIDAGGIRRRAALRTLGRRHGAYDPALLSALVEKLEAEGDESEAVPLMAHELRPGMTIVSDVTDGAGRLLVGRGYQVTESLIARIRHWKAATVISEPIYVSSGGGRSAIPSGAAGQKAHLA